MRQATQQLRAQWKSKSSQDDEGGCHRLPVASNLVRKMPHILSLCDLDIRSRQEEEKIRKGCAIRHLSR